MLLDKFKVLSPKFVCKPNLFIFVDISVISQPDKDIFCILFSTCKNDSGITPNGLLSKITFVYSLNELKSEPPIESAIILLLDKSSVLTPPAPSLSILFFILTGNLSKPLFLIDKLI